MTARKKPHPNFKHGMSKTPTYHCWNAMLQRCRTPHHSSYVDYGARGISVDKRWDKFENFLEDMGIKPKNLELDRVDNNGNYSKSNCKWSTHSENNLNTRRNRKITHSGISKCLYEWTKEYNIHPSTFRSRLERGMSIEEIISTPVKCIGAGSRRAKLNKIANN